MQIGYSNNKRLSIDNELIENVNKFVYLGSVFTPEGGTEDDVTSRLGKATGVFRKLQKIWSLYFISLRVKLQKFTIQSFFQQPYMQVKLGNLQLPSL